METRSEGGTKVRGTKVRKYARRLRVRAAACLGQAGCGGRNGRKPVVTGSNSPLSPRNEGGGAGGGGPVRSGIEFSPLREERAGRGRGRGPPRTQRDPS